MTLAVGTPYTVPAGFMDALQITLLVLVAAGATAVVLVRRPVQQVLVLSVYGILLAVLFLAFQAPDVTLSELTVGAVALPIMRHRIIPNFSAQSEGVTADDITRKILQAIPKSQACARARQLSTSPRA